MLNAMPQMPVAGTPSQQTAPQPAVMPAPASMPTQAPAPASTSPAPVVIPAPVSTEGPETIDSSEKIGYQGNWLKKREWLIKANDVLNEIIEVANQTEPTRKLFMEKNNAIDAALDAYYKQLGLDQGKVQELFDGILRYLDKKRKKDLATLIPKEGEQKDPELQAKIDVLEEAAKLSKQKLEQLKLDMKSVEDLDKSLAERLKRVDEQVNVIQEDVTKAQNQVNELWDIIDHHKARTIYYELKNNILEKIKSIQQYLKEDLLNDFDAVSETIKQQIAKTQDDTKKLEEEGIFVRDRARRVKELKLKEIQLGKEAAEEAAKQPSVPEKQKPPQTWRETLYAKTKLIITKFIGAVLNAWSSLTQWISGKASTPQPSLPTTITPVTPSPQPPAPITTPPAPTSEAPAAQPQTQPTTPQPTPQLPISAPQTTAAPTNP